MQAKRKRSSPGTSMDSRSNEHGLDLLRSLSTVGLFERVWPRERVLLGVRVCRWTRDNLPALVSEVELRVSKAHSGTPPELVTRSILRFTKVHAAHNAPSLRMVCRDDPRAWPVMLEGMVAALREGGAQLPCALKKLDLCMSGLGDEGAAELAGVLELCTNVTELDLGANFLGGEPEQGVRRLAAAVGLCTGLTHFNLAVNVTAGLEPLLRAVGNCAALTHLNLAQAGLPGQGVGFLVALLPKLSQLSCLDITGNVLEEDDALRLFPTLPPSLTSLAIGHNQITAPAAAALAATLTSMRGLSDLCVPGENSTVIPTLMAALAQCSHLTRLDLSRSILDTPAAESIRALLSAAASSLAHLSAAGLEAAACRPVLSGIAGCALLTHLDLQDSALESAPAELCVALEGAAGSLRSLNLHGCRVSRRAGRRVAIAIANCRVLEHLDLSLNTIGPEGGRAIAQVLQRAPQQSRLAFVDLRGNEIGPCAVELVAGCARSLTHLELAGNALEAKGVQALARVLGECGELAHLGMFNNGLRDSGVSLLAAALTGCSTLTRLELSENALGDPGCEALAQALPEVPRLKVLMLEQNAIGDAGLSALADAFPRCRALQDVCVDVNEIGDEGVRALAERLKHCALVDLSLNENPFGDEGATALAAALAGSGSVLRTSLQRLQMSCVEYKAEGLGALVPALEGCSALRFLDAYLGEDEEAVRVVEQLRRKLGKGCCIIVN